MGNLEKHATTELRRAGWFRKSGMYGGMIGPSVLKLVKTFAAEGHSGMSGRIALTLFHEVARFRPLSKLTDNPKEWMDVADGTSDRKPLWQSRRKPSCFSHDGGKTYYDIDEKRVRGKHKIHTSEVSATRTVRKGRKS